MTGVTDITMEKLKPRLIPKDADWIERGKVFKMKVTSILLDDV